jgi:hypothetical protein
VDSGGPDRRLARKAARTGLHHDGDALTRRRWPALTLPSRQQSSPGPDQWPRLASLPRRDPVEAVPGLHDASLPSRRRERDSEHQHRHGARSDPPDAERLTLPLLHAPGHGRRPSSVRRSCREGPCRPWYSTDVGIRERTAVEHRLAHVGRGQNSRAHYRRVRKASSTFAAPAPPRTPRRASERARHRIVPKLFGVLRGKEIGCIGVARRRQHVSPRQQDAAVAK